VGPCHDATVKVHLIDGTYELFRHHYGLPEEARTSTTAATRGVLNSLLYMLDEGVTHIGVATDHVVESFRNHLWPGYKSSAGMPPELLVQFPLLEEGLAAMGVVVWPMVEYEADDALASAAAVAADDPEVEQVIICTPDKDLGQCVVGSRVVQLDRRKQVLYDADGIKAKFGVEPTSIPDYLALVGDSSDGFPGLPGWGAKTTAAVLARYGHIEDIPLSPGQWDVPVRGAGTLALTLANQMEDARLFKLLATLRVERDLLPSVGTLRWPGPAVGFAEFCAAIDGERVLEKALALGAKVKR
jgi:5'-3' exonuclease